MPPPQNQIVSNTVFSTDQTANSAMVGLYSQMGASLTLYSGALSIYCGLAADELISVYQLSEDMPFYNNAILSNDPTVQGAFWVPAYADIYQANAILDGVSNSTGMSEAMKTQLTGEAKFVRAATYFYLTNLFGDVPLPLTTNATTNASLARTPAAQVYQQIITDLRDAQTLLAVTTDNTRPSQLAATALLARVYLYQKDWADAETAATAVISSGSYILDSITNVFMNTSKETIWQLVPPAAATGFNTTEGYNFGAAGGYILYQMTPALLSAFEPGDKRDSQWVGSFVSGNDTAYYPYKYKAYFSYTLTEDEIVLRLAEQYLIRAEARAEQGKNITGAQQDLNMVRNRAGLPATTATTPSSLETAILHERQVEFFAEYGQRWLDLKRTAQIDAVLGADKSGWKSYSALFPIPLIDIQHDVNLTQNSGYQ